MFQKTIEKLRKTITSLCTNISHVLRKVKGDENAMEVIQVVMLIAVGVLAIVAVWAGINGLLEKWWGMITGADIPGGPGI